MASYRIEKLTPRILLHADNGADSQLLAETISPTAEIALALSERAFEQIEFADTSSAEAHAEHDSPHLDTPHPGDPVRKGEHQALLHLVPDEQVTHRAIVDGPWSHPDTWEGGQLPADQAHVLIPEHVTVVVDARLEARLSTIRVDGTLNFSTEVDTSLQVDTLVVAVEGTLNIGTHDQPIAPEVTASILFTDTGPINTTWDPTLLSRGLISHGSASLFGASKSGPIDLATAPEAGDTELQLATAPEGWQVGDRILVPGVLRPAENNRGKTLLDEDEIVVITAIAEDGTQIEIDQALAYDHVPPQAQLTLPVANLDRNIQFTSENTTDPQRAGHMMFMHSANATVNYAAFRHLGRNDKSLETTDPQLDQEGNLLPGTGANARGRYAVHFHRIGSEKIAATVTGSVVENNPGWGFVNHDSNVVFRENVSYNVKGAGFVTEIGSERGAFIGNLAVRSRGKNFYQPQSASDKGAGTGFGSAGHGFWLQSPSVALIDNVAAGHAQEGIFIHNRTLTEANRELPTYASLIDVPAGTPLEFTSGADQPAIRDGQIRPDQVPLAEVSGNKIFASGAGIGVRWRRQTSALSEGSEGDVIEDFEIWNVRWAGIHLGYVSGLTFRNGLILGDVDDPISLSKKEQSSRDTETSEYHSSYGKGILANRNSQNLTFENLEVAGFLVGIQALTQSHTKIDSVRLQNVENLLIVTPQATSLSNDVRRIDATNVENIPLTPQALAGRTPYNVRLLKQIDRAPVAGGSKAAHEWAAFLAADEIYYNGQRLYFYEQAPDAIPFPADEAPAFMTKPKYEQYLDLTNQELLDQFDLALGGEVALAEALDAFGEAGIAALAVELDIVPQSPQPVKFRFDVAASPSVWSLNDSDLQLTWQTQGVSADTPWRIYLNGEEGTQEIGRLDLPSEFAQASAGDLSEGWQTWNFQWPRVGQLPDWWEGDVVLGKHSLLAVADGSPAVYLGQVTIAPEIPIEASIPQISADADPDLPIDAASLLSLEIVETVTDKVVLPTAIDEAHTSPKSIGTEIEVLEYVEGSVELEEPEEEEEEEEEELNKITRQAIGQLYGLELFTDVG